MDSAGNVYVAESFSSTIRKVTPTGVATTFAGTAYEYGSTDGPDSVALFRGPSGLAVDSAGNVYVADSSNHTIRKVTPAGVVTTLAGGAGLSGNTDGTGSGARFYYPRGVAVDSAGNVYVADNWNSVIRKVTPAGDVTTLAGSAGISGSADGTGSAARFRDPTGVAVDSVGNVYVGDSLNHTIRKVTPAGAVSTLVGGVGLSGSTDGTGSAARFSYPRGVAVDSAGNVYVADSSNHTIRKVTPTGGVTTLAGTAGGGSGSTNGTGGAARFNYPSAVAVDSAGSVYVADTINDTIRKVTTTGGVTTFAGTAATSGSTDGTGSAARFSGPRGVAVDSAGNVYVADYNNHTIRKVTPAGVVTTLAGSAGLLGSADGTGSAARFNYPYGVAVDSSGNVYVADNGNHTIRKVTPTGGVTTLAGSTGLAGSIDGTGSAARFFYPYGVAVDNSDNVYVADYTNDTIRKVSPAGVVRTIGGLAGYTGWGSGYDSASRFNSPSSVAVSAIGRIYVTDFVHRVVQGEAGFQPILTQGNDVSMTVRGVTLNGTVNPNGFATTAAFEYGTTQSYGSSASVALTPATGTTAQNVSTGLTGLSPGTLYYYRLTATNVDGTAYTTGGTFTTSAPSTNADLSNLSLSNGTLSPAFASATTAYTASVASTPPSITVTPTLAQAEATLAVRINGGTYAPVTSGSPSGDLPIAIGVSTIDVRVTAQDGVTQKIYTVTLTVSSSNSGVALTTWRQQYFGSDQNSGNAADLATPDGDGIPNLIKYALLMTPGESGSSRLPQVAITGATGSRRLTITFQRDPSRNDVAIVVEAQSGLDGGWTEIARSTNGADFTGAAEVSESAGANGSKTVTVQDSQANASRRFMRVRVER